MPFSLADDEDIWYRWVLLTNEPQGDKSGMYKYFEKYFDPPEFERPWRYELSGRLASIAPDFISDAQTKSRRLNEFKKKPSFDYRGRWIAIVAAVRALAAFDVYHEPVEIEPADPAHANLVCLDPSLFDETGKITPFAIDDLLDRLQWEPPA